MRKSAARKAIAEKAVPQILADALGVDMLFTADTNALHSSSIEAVGTPPNCVPKLLVWDWNDGKQGTLVAEIVLNDFCSLAQQLYVCELIHNLKLDSTSRAFKSRVKRLRKALGYSYP